VRHVPLEQALAVRQRRFYARAGLDAFDGTVPFRLSTSRAMARVVVQAALAFAHQQGKARVRLVDVGAGTGRLGFHVLQLEPRMQVVLTDASRRLVAQWRVHPQLATAPRLSFVRASAYALGAALNPAPDEALVVVGTYLLDTLPHALLEAPSGRRAFVDKAGGLTFQAARLDDFARAYLQRLGHGRAFLPVGAFAFIAALERQVRTPTLLLLADKMATTVEQAREDEQLRLVSHGAGASVLVNLEALRGWLGWRGWQQAAGGSADFVVGATVLKRGRLTLPPLFEGPHPLDVQAQVTALRDDPHVVAGVLQLSPDGDVLLELAEALERQAEAIIDDGLRKQLGAWLLEAARGAFFLPADDVSFHAGRVLHRLGFAAAAVACFSQSVQCHGDLAVTRVHRARSLAALGAASAARDDLHEVLRREPRHAEALALLARLG
jgi:precorrin-6B methylase 2